jgi:hypothetical protein
VSEARGSGARTSAALIKSTASSDSSAGYVTSWVLILYNVSWGVTCKWQPGRWAMWVASNLWDCRSPSMYHTGLLDSERGRYTLQFSIYMMCITVSNYENSNIV